MFNKSIFNSSVITANLLSGCPPLPPQKRKRISLLVCVCVCVCVREGGRGRRGRRREGEPEIALGYDSSAYDMLLNRKHLLIYRFYKTSDYQVSNLTIFKSQWIHDVLYRGGPCQAPISDYILVEPDIYKGE